MVVPVRVGSHKGVAFETTFQDGVRREALRSLAQLANASELHLEVRAVSRRILLCDCWSRQAPACCKG